MVKNLICETYFPDLPSHLRRKKFHTQGLSKKVGKLQRKIFKVAKLQPEYKFDDLYDKVCLDNILKAAYLLSKANGGCSGVDRVTFNAIEKSGNKDFIANLKSELTRCDYSPSPLRRVSIKKSKTQKRPLGIPTIKDRVVQTACKLVLEPVFEADFSNASFGYRPKRSAGKALRVIKHHLEQGKTTIYKADLSKYFDTIPHGPLLHAVQKRIKDTRVIHLIKLWLGSPVREKTGQYSGGAKHKKGTPQGGVISPLLANIFLNDLDHSINNPESRYARQGVQMVRYADDFLLIGARIEPGLIQDLHRKIERMGLTINKTKSRLLQARDTAFHFLGFDIQYRKQPFGEKNLMWHIAPCEEAQNRIKRDIDQMLKKIPLHSPMELALILFPILKTWMGYYSMGRSLECQIPLIPIYDYLERKLLYYYQRKQPGQMVRFEPGASLVYANQAFSILKEELNR